MKRLTIAALLLLASSAPAQILHNGNFATGDLSPWRFFADAGSDPLMVAEVATFQNKQMFRLNPGHNGSGGWKGGILQQSFHLEAGIYHITGKFYIQNLRTGTNSNGGQITIAMNGHEVFHSNTTTVNGLEVITIPVNLSYRAVQDGEHTLRIRFARPWRNSNPVSIFHWASDLSVARPFCYANCDGSTATPLLNIDDFTCFINRFAEAQGLPPATLVDHYANCDASTTQPVLNVDDYICFISAFAAGCP